MMRSSSSGIAWFWPSTRSYGCALPAVPSSIGATSTRTMWPGAGFSPVTGIHAALAS